MRYGPWIDARFDGECAECGCLMQEGDRICADGEGGWICEICEEYREDD